MQQKFYDLIDLLNKEWQTVEYMILSYIAIPMGDAGGLSLRRADNGKMRLCYRERPLLECSATDKMAAVAALPKFKNELKNFKWRMTEVAAESLEDLRKMSAEILKDFESKK